MDTLPNSQELVEFLNKNGNFALVCEAPEDSQVQLSVHDYQVLGKLMYRVKPGAKVTITKEENTALNRLVVHMRYYCEINEKVKLSLPPVNPTKQNVKTKKGKAQPEQKVVVKPTEVKQSDIPKNEDIKLSEIIYVKKLHAKASETGNWLFKGKDKILYDKVMDFNIRNNNVVWNSIKLD